MRRADRLLCLVLLSLSLVFGLIVWVQGESGAPAPRQAAWTAQVPASTEVNNPFAASLQGTQPDGALKLRQAQLVLNPELLYLFDYYLATLGERQLPEIIAEVQRALAQQLQLHPTALAQALALFERYLTYKRSLQMAPAANAARTASQSQSELMQQRWQFLAATRAQHFSAQEITGLFGGEEQRFSDAYQRMRIYEDAALTPEQKQAGYAALDQALSPAARAEKNAPVFIQTVEQEVARMRANKVDEQTVYQYRAAQFSADAAARLAELEREEQAWQQRIAAYLVQARQILAQQPIEFADLTAQKPAQAAALARLRERSFNSDERMRLPAYETW